MSNAFWWIMASVNGFLAVAAGAFGAHTLASRLTPKMRATFETGARYHMYHALALLGVALLAQRAPSAAVGASGWCFAVGILLFSGSLYALALTGWERLGPITPFGGTLFMVGWILLGIAGARTAL